MPWLGSTALIFCLASATGGSAGVDDQFFPLLLRLLMGLFSVGAEEGKPRTNPLGMVPGTALVTKSRNRGSRAACPASAVMRCAARICKFNKMVNTEAEVLSLVGRGMMAGPS
jgi:hypothetical protein